MLPGEPGERHCRVRDRQGSSREAGALREGEAALGVREAGGEGGEEARVERQAGRLEVEPGGVEVRELGYRWGSCGKGGRLYFHWRSILLPPRIVEYVVVHELVHLREPHHTPAFWRAVERVLPDYAARKQWLAEHGASVGAL
jgi:hypothetical protein